MYNNSIETQGIQCFSRVLQSHRHRINVIGVNESIDEHIEDCLIALEYFITTAHILLHTQNSKTTTNNLPLSCIDLGSGGGFPGILLMLCFYARNIPSHWYLLEKSPKKCAFLSTVIHALHTELQCTLPVSIVNANLYNWQWRKELTHTTQSSLVTARAFRPLSNQLVQEMKHTFAPAHILLYKGREETITKELQSLSNPPHDSVDFNVTRIIPLTCSHNKKRHLVHATL